MEAEFCEWDLDLVVDDPDLEFSASSAAPTHSHPSNSCWLFLLSTRKCCMSSLSDLPIISDRYAPRCACLGGPCSSDPILPGCPSRMW